MLFGGVCCVCYGVFVLVGEMRTDEKIRYSLERKKYLEAIRVFIQYRSEGDPSNINIV